MPLWREGISMATHADMADDLRSSDVPQANLADRRDGRNPSQL